MEDNVKAPDAYITGSKERGYALVYKGIPITVDGRTLEQCQKMAAISKIIITHSFDGEKGDGFQELK